MEGDQLIGRIDLKRNGVTLDITAFWPEPGVKMGEGRIKRLEAEIDRATRFAGCDEAVFAQDWLRATFA